MRTEQLVIYLSLCKSLVSGLVKPKGYLQDLEIAIAPPSQENALHQFMMFQDGFNECKLPAARCNYRGRTQSKQLRIHALSLQLKGAPSADALDALDQSGQVFCRHD